MKLEEILEEMLDCGDSSLEQLKNIKYDCGTLMQTCFNDVLGEGRYEERRNPVTFEDVIQTAIDMGIEDINKAINDRLAELANKKASGIPLTIDEITEEFELKKLDVEIDFSVDFDCVVFIHNQSIYEKYLSKALEDFRINTGGVEIESNMFSDTDSQFRLKDSNNT